MKRQGTRAPAVGESRIQQVMRKERPARPWQRNCTTRPASASMRENLGVNSRPARMLLVAMVLVAAGVGCCLFDGDHHGTLDSLDLCSGLAIVSVAAIPLAFVPIYPLPIDRPYMVHAVPLHRLDPPPKSASLS